MHNTIKRLEKILKAYGHSNTPPSKKLPASNTKPRNGNGTKRKQDWVPFFIPITTGYGIKV